MRDDPCLTREGGLIMEQVGPLKLISSVERLLTVIFISLAIEQRISTNDP